MKYTKEHPLRVFTAFSGYDSQCLALERLKEKNPYFDYELVGWSEVEMNAIAAHNAIFPQYKDRNYGDISAINWGGGKFLILTCLPIHFHVKAFRRRVSKLVLKRAQERDRRFYGSAGRLSRSNALNTL